jgi:hypothetical protein
LCIKKSVANKEMHPVKKVNRPALRASTRTAPAPKEVTKKQDSSVVAKKPQRPARVARSSTSHYPMPQMTPERIEEIEVLERNKLRKEVLKKHLGANAHLMRKAEENMYFKTMVDPERYTGVRYPDDFGRKTATLASLLNHDCYIFPTDQIVEPPGTYLNVVAPGLVNPVLEYTMAPLSGITTNSLVQAVVSQQTSTYGLFPIDQTQPSIMSDTDQMYLVRGDWNIRAPFFVADLGETGNAFPMFRGENTDGQFYGMPVLGDASDALATVNIVCNVPRQATGTLASVVVEAVTVHGSVSKAVTETVDLMILTAAFSAAELATVLVTDGDEFAAGLPGLGFRIRCTNNDVIPILTVTTRFIPKTLEPIPQFKAIQLPDVTVYQNSADEYRPISASAWLEYQGADLTNGGQAAAIMFRGGQPFTYNKLWDYDRVAETPGGYQGALKLGSYSFWFPASISDTLFRPVTTDFEWGSPYIVNVGLVASPDLPHVLRLRVPMNFELLSTAQFFSYAVSDIKPEWLSQTAMLIRSVPTSMENPAHLDFIGGLLDKGVDGLAGIAKGLLGSIF